MSQFSLFCDEQKNHLLGKKLNHSALWVANLSYITGFQGLICLSKIILNFLHCSVQRFCHNFLSFVMNKKIIYISKLGKKTNYGALWAANLFLHLFLVFKDLFVTCQFRPLRDRIYLSLIHFDEISLYLQQISP